MISEINKTANSLFICYSRLDFQKLWFLIADFRIELSSKRLRVRTGEARRRQGERIYINTYKWTKPTLKSDTSCRSYFEDDNKDKIHKFRILRAEVEMEEEILRWFVEKRQAIQSAEIDLKTENKYLASTNQ